MINFSRLYHVPLVQSWNSLCGLRHFHFNILVSVKLTGCKIIVMVAIGN